MHPALTLVVATPPDAAVITALLEASYPALLRDAYPHEILQRALPLITRANPTLLASGTYYLVRDNNGQAVGCGGWTHEKPGTKEREPGIGHLRHFGTHAVWTGQGIGRLIYKNCEIQARAAGLIRFDVYATINATPFYTSLGFSKIEDIVVTLPHNTPFPSVWMSRPI